MINNIIILTIFLLSFLITLFLMPFWIRKAKQINFVWKDMNKFSSNKVAGSGGIIVVLGFVISILILVAYKVFYLKSTDYLIEIFALLNVLIILAGIGLVDDLLGWQKGGLSKRSRLILVAVSAIPLMAINAGKSSMSIPFFGVLDFGIFYPLLLIPIGIVGATTTYNFLAGFNGLEAGQGIIILSSLSIVSFLTGSFWLGVICLCMVFSLLAFLTFNFYPAKVFPGDVVTYPIGGLIAISSILGNFEKIAVFFFLPYILEVVLKSRGHFIKSSFGKPNKDNSLNLKYEKIYGLTHLSIYILKKLKMSPTEKKVVFLIWGFQIAVIMIGFIMFI